MTDDRMALAELPEKGSDGDLLREMIGFMTQRLMVMDEQALAGADHRERSDKRENWRNGYGDRIWHTRAGTAPLKMQKLRSGSYFPAFLEPRRSAEKAMAAVIQEAYAQGISTRSVDELVKALGMTGISKGHVSRLCEEIDEWVDAINMIFAQESAEAAHAQWRVVTDQQREKFPRLAAMMMDAEHGVLSFMDFPKELRAKIHSTNVLKRLNGKIKRRCDVAGIVRNERAIRRLVGALPLEQNDEYAIRKRYMILVSPAAMSENPPSGCRPRRR